MRTDDLMKRADEILAWEMRASGDDYTYEDVVRLAFVLLTEEQEDFDDHGQVNPNKKQA